MLTALDAADIVGWLGSCLIACCLGPQALKLYSTRSGGDISACTLALQLLGNCCTIFYAVARELPQIITTSSIVVVFLLTIASMKALCSPSLGRGAFSHGANTATRLQS